jgi:hypothetical protein
MQGSSEAIRKARRRRSRGAAVDRPYDRALKREALLGWRPQVRLFEGLRLIDCRVGRGPAIAG